MEVTDEVFESKAQLYSKKLRTECIQSKLMVATLGEF